MREADDLRASEERLKTLLVRELDLEEETERFLAMFTR
jgi:hypothetical protein